MMPKPRPPFAPFAPFAPFPTGSAGVWTVNGVVVTPLPLPRPPPFAGTIGAAATGAALAVFAGSLPPLRRISSCAVTSAIRSHSCHSVRGSASPLRPFWPLAAPLPPAARLTSLTPLPLPLPLAGLTSAAACAALSSFSFLFSSLNLRSSSCRALFASPPSLSFGGDDGPNWSLRLTVSSSVPTDERKSCVALSCSDTGTPLTANTFCPAETIPDSAPMQPGARALMQGASPLLTRVIPSLELASGLCRRTRYVLVWSKPTGPPLPPLPPFPPPLPIRAPLPYSGASPPLPPYPLPPPRVGSSGASRPSLPPESLSSCLPS